MIARAARTPACPAIAPMRRRAEAGLMLRVSRRVMIVGAMAVSLLAITSARPVAAAWTNAEFAKGAVSTTSVTPAVPVSCQLQSIGGGANNSVLLTWRQPAGGAVRTKYSLKVIRNGGAISDTWVDPAATSASVPIPANAVAGETLTVWVIAVSSLWYTTEAAGTVTLATPATAFASCSFKQ